jgi:asparagine N-glycosylation enzyme membrane subunit Stt3
MIDIIPEMMDFILTVMGVILGALAVIVIFINIRRITDFFRHMQ